MIKPLSLYLVLYLLTETVSAQTSLLTERYRQPLSPGEMRYDKVATTMDVYLLRQLYTNPAYYQVAQTDSLCNSLRYRSIVCTTLAQGRSKGDFLPYEGDASRDVRLFGVGEYTFSSAGTLFGSAQYARGRHDRIGWSSARQPQRYLPYVSTDSVGGDFHYEDYRVEGGYAFRIADWRLGIDASFYGEQAWRKTDPRALNNTTWLRTAIGIARSFNDHLVMWQGGAGRNKQHVSLRYWRPGQQDRFFVAYGFGLYDFRKSGVFFGYSRMYYVSELNTRIDYRSPLRRRLMLRAGTGLCYDRMRAEESDIQDLYLSKTYRFTPYLRFDWRATSSLTLSLFADADISRRKGYEHIFEEYLADEANNIYDFRLIDTQQHYSLGSSEGLFRLRLRYRLDKRHTLSVSGGTSLFMREEKYAGEGYRIENKTAFPHARLNYRLDSRRTEWEWGLWYGRQLRLGSTYEVTMRNQSIDHLDFQHAFAPYAYYDAAFSTLALTASCMRHIGSYGVGASLHFMWTDGKRNANAVYTQRVGFASSAPMISTAPDRHDEYWGSASLFLVF